jgi:hypothetical protein
VLNPPMLTSQAVVVFPYVNNISTQAVVEPGAVDGWCRRKALHQLGLVRMPPTPRKAATLPTACTAASTPLGRSKNLRVSVGISTTPTSCQGVLTVAVAVVDGQAPRAADTMRTPAAVTERHRL